MTEHGPPPDAAASDDQVDRREFLKQSAGTVAAAGAIAATAVGGSVEANGATVAARERYTFVGPDSLYHGNGWESLNPGYWKVSGGALRRRLSNVGDRARRTGFPFHSQTAGRSLETEYDPSLPVGVIYRNDWQLRGAYTVTARFTFRGVAPKPAAADNPNWRMYQPGYGELGVVLGAQSLFESYNKVRHAWRVRWTDDGTFDIAPPPARGRRAAATRVASEAPELEPGDEVTIRVMVRPVGQDRAEVRAEMEAKGRVARVTQRMPARAAEGFVGISGRGLIDFEVNEFLVDAESVQPTPAGHVGCYACYALGDTLRESDGDWRVKFVALFAGDGRRAEIRISDSPQPDGGWESVPVAGSAQIVNHSWRRNTAVIDATLPVNPAEATLYYTVWKDGRDVTADPRIGSAATGPGTGLVGDVPATGQYVGRLPQLTAPYKLCGLSCHAITSGLQQRDGDGFRVLGGGDKWQFRDQPTVGAYRTFEEYEFQVMVWEDDVWYMELVLYPPSTDDAYKVVVNSICGPTSRWQMMRHWNVINPGDHDYGMDDVKGPEQIAIRTVDGLGQDASYMRRNFQIVHHLITGAEEVDPRANPKKWRAWKMPNRDFTFIVLDSRLWRSSQDVDMWDDAGWGKFKSLYDRTDPTRSLLGEEQFSWLQQQLATDSSGLICLTGINGMHTIWAGGKGNNSPSAKHPKLFDQRDRVTADYAGWVKAGADRVLELLGSREGVVTVYGDVHNGCIMRNVEQGVIECSFGPIGRSGGRAVIPGFGPRMKDVDGRDVEVKALYHAQHADPQLQPHAANQPFYWNFLEMEFDPRPDDALIHLRVRNLVDSPQQAPRGGGALQTTAAQTGRVRTSRLADLTTLPNADVLVRYPDGRAIKGLRSRPDGRLPSRDLVDIAPGTLLIVTAFDGQKSASQTVRTESL